MTLLFCPPGTQRHMAVDHGVQKALMLGKAVLAPRFKMYI